MADWNWKKDLLWGLGLTAILIGVYYAWQEFLSWQATQSANAANAANLAASTAAENASQLSTEVAQVQAYTTGSAPSGSAGSVVASSTAGASPTASTPISSGAQIASVDPATILAQIQNLGSVTNPTPVAPIQIQPLSNVTGVPNPTTSPAGVAANVPTVQPNAPLPVTSIAKPVTASTAVTKPTGVTAPTTPVQMPIAAVPSNLQINDTHQSTVN